MLCEGKDKEYDGGCAYADCGGQQELNELVDQLLLGCSVGVGNMVVPTDIGLSFGYGFHIR